MNKVSVAVIGLALWLGACGDSGSGGGGAAAGGAAAGGAAAGGAAAGGASTGGGAQGGAGGGVAAPEAPVLDMLEPVHGALHVFWTNATPDCDMVHGERKTATDPYAEVFAVPGNVDNKADMTATDTTATYTYRLACEKGGVMSAYSNELSGMPQ